MARLIALSGLPGVGKTTLARTLCATIRAIHLRVDSAETAMKRSVLQIQRAKDAGYQVLAALALDNLRLGFDVVADTVNPIAFTRELWAETAAAAGATLVNVEIICSDRAQHRSQIETRLPDLPGQSATTWAQVQSRTYEPWSTPVIRIDTNAQSVEACVTQLVAALAR